MSTGPGPLPRIPLPLPELRARIRLRLLAGCGDRAHVELVRRFGSARAALEAPEPTFAAAAGREAALARRGPAPREAIEGALTAVRESGMVVRAWGKAGYPAALDELHDPPPILFVRGEPALLHRRAVAVVGTRRASAYGRRVGAAVAARLARAGVTVVSGLALGVDAAAHGAALDAGGTTVAVLGTGADVPYPRTNLRLFRRILREGAVVSEFLPGEEGLPHNFPRRNRIIAALSRAVVVAEAPARSGALITVEHALDLGREIFSVPGSIERETSDGTNALLRDGAHVVTGPGAVLAVLGWEDASDGSVGTAPPVRLGSGARRVWRVLAREPLHVDEVARRAEVEVGDALSALLTLEVEGFVRQHEGGLYARSPGEGPGQ